MKLFISGFLATLFLFGCAYAENTTELAYYQKFQEKLDNRIGLMATTIAVLSGDGKVQWTGKDDFGHMSGIDESSAIRQIALGGGYSLCLLENGEIIYHGNKESEFQSFEQFEEITMIGSTRYAGFALNNTGTVNCLFNRNGSTTAFNLKSWNNIKSISTGDNFIVGLRNDGTIVSSHPQDPRCKVSKWENIIQVAAGHHFTIGLKNDGTVVGTGEYWGWGTDGEEVPEADYDLSGWKDIVQVAAGDNFFAGLKSDGTICIDGWEKFYKGQHVHDALDWENVVYIRGLWNVLVGIQADGTVLTAGRLISGDINVDGWKAFEVQ